MFAFAHIIGRIPAVRRIATVATIAIAATACGGSDKKDSTGPDGSIAGTYTLREAASSALPASIFAGQIDLGDGVPLDVVISVRSGSIRLEADGSFTGTMALDIEFEDGTLDAASLPVSGEYSRQGNTIVFSSDDPEDEPFQATLGDGVISAEIDLFGTGEPIALTFRK
jgi:hypothetical protein